MHAVEKLYANNFLFFHQLHIFFKRARHVMCLILRSAEMSKEDCQFGTIPMRLSKPKQTVGLMAKYCRK